MVGQQQHTRRPRSVQGLAQQANELQPKDHEVWTRNPLQGYVFYQIQEKQDSQVRPFEEVREVATISSAREARS